MRITTSLFPRQVWLIAVFVSGLIGMMAAVHFVAHFAIRPPVTEVSPRRMSQSEAELLAQDLCQKLTGSKVEVVETAGYDSAPGVANPILKTWEVTCRDTKNQYLIEINAESSELVLFRHEPDLSPSDDQSSVPLTPLPHRQALRLARHYLKNALIPLPSDAQLLSKEGGYSFLFQSSLSNGQNRLVQVYINRDTGNLESLRNTVYRKAYPSHLP